MNRNSHDQRAATRQERRRVITCPIGSGEPGPRLSPGRRPRRPSTAALSAVFGALPAFVARRRARAAALAAGLLCTLALVVAPSAAANVDLAAGMPINIGNHGCSLGFFGFNARHDRLAVTAGHCSDSVPNEPVYADNGVKIGEVVAWKEDLQGASGKLIGARGYTIVFIYRRFSLEPFFSGVSSSVSDGDYVTKFGQRTGKTNGVIKSVQYDAKRPALALLSSNMVQLPGDSGCPWYNNGTTLVGMGSSGDQEWAGGDAGSQAQPIQAVLDMIRTNGNVWGQDFTVWTQ